MSVMNGFMNMSNIKESKSYLLNDEALIEKYGVEAPLYLKKLAETEETREDQIFTGVKLLITTFKGGKIKGEDTLRGEWIDYMFFNIYMKNDAFYQRDIVRIMDKKAVYENAKKRYRTVVNIILSHYHGICSSEQLCRNYGLGFCPIYADEIKAKTLERHEKISAKKKEKNDNFKREVIESLTVEELLEFNPDLVVEIERNAVSSTVKKILKQLDIIKFESFGTYEVIHNTAISKTDNIQLKRSYDKLVSKIVNFTIDLINADEYPLILRENEDECL